MLEQAQVVEEGAACAPLHLIEQERGAGRVMRMDLPYRTCSLQLRLNPPRLQPRWGVACCAQGQVTAEVVVCLLYTSDAADE